MTTSCPAPLLRTVPAGADVQTSLPHRVRTAGADTWRYTAARSSRTAVATAIIISASLHVALLFGFSRTHKAPRIIENRPPMIRLTIPELKDLEEPEPVAVEDSNPQVDLSTLVPMQADLPQLARPTDFVQPLNFASLLEKPDLSNITVTVIPENFHGGRKLAENFGKIFDLADLDRVPEPVIQHSPLYPGEMRREGIGGTVKVEFVVDVEGRVAETQVVETTHRAFNDAAVSAVSKWKFRPGVKNGRKVNTRMCVPIVFTLAGEAG
jgi:protein TonB